MSNRVRGKKKVREILFESLDSQSPGRRESSNQAENSAAIITVDEEELPGSNVEQRPEPKVIKVQPIVLSQSDEEDINRNQLRPQYYPRKKREIDEEEEEDETGGLDQEKDCKKETVDTSPESMLEKTRSQKSKIIFEQNRTEKTEHYDYEQGSDEDEEQEVDKSSEQSESQESVEEEDMKKPPPDKKKKSQQRSKSEKVFKTFVADSIEDLLFSPIPSNCSISCIVAWNDDFFSTKRFYNFYLLEEKKLIISAVKSRISMTSLFEFFSVKKNARSKSIASLKSNFTGMEYVLNKKAESAEQSKQLLWIGYQFNMFGFANERTFTVLHNHKKKLQKVPYFSQIKSYYDNGMKTIFKKFSSRKAIKDKKSGNLLLDYHDKSIKPSGRNAILTNEKDKDCLVLGKKKQEVFMLEISHPFSLIEGFGIAVANLDRKLCVR